MANSEASFAGTDTHSTNGPQAFRTPAEQMCEEIHPFATIRILVNAELMG